MQMELQFRLLVFYQIALQSIDCWTTYQLADYYGWEGELNLLVKGFISQSVYHMVLLKLFVVGPGLWAYTRLWETGDDEYYDWRHDWALYILFTFNVFATGLIVNNMVLYLLLSF